MAIVHISEAEAARDLAGVLAKVRAGEDIRIESGLETFTIVPAEAIPVKLRPASEILASLKKQGSTVTLQPVLPPMSKTASAAMNTKHFAIRGSDPRFHRHHRGATKRRDAGKSH